MELSYCKKKQVSTRFKPVYKMKTQNYIFEEEIGYGSFSNVYKIFNKDDKKHYAIKVIKNNTKIKALSLNEINILKHIRKNDKITEMIETFYINNHLCIVFQLYNINLREFIETHTHLNDSKKISLCSDIVKAIDFIHSNSIIHRDVKPDNIVFKDSTFNTIVLIDFSFSTKSNQQLNIYNYSLQTISYRAPEVYFKYKCNFGLDIWSLGCVMYEIMYETILFQHCKTNIDLFIKHNIILGPPKFIKTLPSELKTMYDSLDEPIFIKYNTIHPFKHELFINNHLHKHSVFKIIIKCLEWTCEERPKASDIKII